MKGFISGVVLLGSLMLAVCSEEGQMADVSVPESIAFEGAMLQTYGVPHTEESGFVLEDEREVQTLLTAMDEAERAGQ